MKTKRKILIVILAFCMVLGLAACGSNQVDANEISVQSAEASPPEPSVQVEPETTQTAQAETEETSVTPSPAEAVDASASDDIIPVETDSSSDGADVLVVYFSATGTTKGIAEMIANITNADIYEIIPAEPYSDADLDWNDSSSRTTKEQNDASVRPEIASETINLQGYSTIYVGYPIWWGEEPRIMDTFVESYDFGDATMIPFCTSGGSGIGRSGKNLAENAGNGNWLDGERLSSSVSEDELSAWIDSFN